MKIFLLIFSIIGLLISAFISATSQGLACAFGHSQPCPFDWPWDMRGDDFIYLGLPQLIFAALLIYSLYNLIRR